MEIMALISRYWWVAVLVVLVIVAVVKIHGYEGDGGDTSGPCEVNGSSGCM